MERPLEGLLFSSTGLTHDADHYIQRVEEMGGRYRTSMGLSTSAIIVAQRFTPKYNYSVENRLRIRMFSPEFIDKLYADWRAGSLADAADALDAGRMQVFHKLRICVTNFQHEKEKRIYENLINTHGGSFTTTLTVHCDLLLSQVLKGPKVAGADMWKIPVVDPRWVIDSIRHGVALPPTHFLTSLPESQRGVKEPEPAAAAASVAGSVNLSSLNAPANEETASSASVVVRPNRKRHWDPILNRNPVPPKRTLSPAVAGRPADGPVKASGLTKAGQLQNSPGLFTGLSFSLDSAFSSQQLSILKRTIESHDGVIFDSEPDYHVVFSASKTNSACRFLKSKIITEWALERSLHRKTCLLNDVWALPLAHTRLAEFQGVEMCVSGFSGIELLHLGKLVQLLGATLCETLVPSRHLVIAKTKACRKYLYAREWGIPVVAVDWLWECAKQGKAVDISCAHALDQLGGRPFRAGPRSAPLIPKPEPRPVPEEEPEEQNVYIDDFSEKRAEILLALGEDPGARPVESAGPILRQTRRW